MSISKSNFPEDFSDREVTRKSVTRPLFFLLILVVVLVAGYFFIFQPEEAIELQPPLDQTAIDPIIRAQIEAASQTGTQGSQESVPAPVTDGSEQTTARLGTGDSPAMVDVTVDSMPAPAAPQNQESLAGQTSAESPESSDGGEIARALIRSIRQGKNSLTTDQVHSEAARLQTQNRTTDAYLLYFFAARQGHGPSALALGSMSDPAYYSGTSKLLEGPDPAQALKWYSIAANAQVEGAQERLQKLRASIEAAAAAGDNAAERLLLNWK